MIVAMLSRRPQVPALEGSGDITLLGVEAQDVRIVLRGVQIGLADDPIVDHRGQPADYVHTDGTVWTWRKRWRIVAGTRLRMYDLIE
jgi:hypothetical protein